MKSPNYRSESVELITALRHKPLSWGAGLDVDTDELRTAYRRALERVHGGEIADLLAFARP
jgi:hypothetical protein